MSNPLFENPKVALGFGAIVLAGGLMAAVAFNELSPEDPGADPVVAATEAETSSSNEGSSGYSDDDSGFADDGGGWADGEGFSDDWGTGVIGNGRADPNQDGATSTADAPEFGDFASDGPSQGGRPAETPGVKSGAAPGAPAIRPPGGGPAQGQLTQVDG